MFSYVEDENSCYSRLKQLIFFALLAITGKAVDYR